MKRTVAVTGLNAGENPQPGAGIIRSLRRVFEDLRIVGLVYGALESSVYIDDGPDVVFQIPYPSAGINALFERLDYILQHEAIDAFIPTLDSEILSMIQAQEAFAVRGINISLPTASSFSARNKNRLSELSKKSDVKVPPGCVVNSEAELLGAMEKYSFPLMVKGIYYDAHMAWNQSELNKHFNAIMQEWGGPVILQSFMVGEEFNVAAVGDGTGGFDAMCMLRKSIRSAKGKGFGGVIIEDPSLYEACVRVINELKWNGPMELEFIKDEQTGEFYLLEINPRFPAWIDFPSNIGCNMPALVLSKLLPDLPAPEVASQCPVGHFFLRHSVDVSGRIEDLGKLTALGEFKRV